MAIQPAPPFAEGTGLPWDVEVAGDAVEAIGTARRHHGDTFAIRSGGDNYLFTVSPTGVESFYALPEERASKGVADYLMLRRKLPDEIFVGRRILPGTLFRRDDVATYLANLRLALDQTVAELGPSGTVNAFDLTRRLGHRMGLASWAGPGCADGDEFDRMVRAFDTLDGSDAFVHPDTMAAVAASGKRAERAALHEVTVIVGSAVHRWRPDTAGNASLFGRIVAAWAEEPTDDRVRGITLDIALIHIASMSNLAAALGWTMVDLLEHPAVAGRIVGGDRANDNDLARRCALESTRLSQRSIMSRTVLAPVSLNVGDAVYDVPPGWTIATLLPLLNTTTAPGLDTWDPDRWTGHRLGDTSALATPLLVTAFGHGRHSCPAQPFSLSAMTTAVTQLFGHYDMTPGWSGYPRPIPAQIGGVARADSSCPISYRAR